MMAAWSNAHPGVMLLVLAVCIPFSVWLAYYQFTANDRNRRW